MKASELSKVLDTLGDYDVCIQKESYNQHGDTEYYLKDIKDISIKDNKFVLKY